MYNENLSPTYRALITNEILEFIPERIYDIHAHLYSSQHFEEDAFPFLRNFSSLSLTSYREAMSRTMGIKKIDGLYFGLPHKSGDRKAINDWFYNEVDNSDSRKNKALKLVSPEDSPGELSNDLKSNRFCGIKVYHIYADRPDTMNASITEYAPEWMWEILNETSGVLMLHIVRHQGIADQDNQKELRRLSRAYPKVKIILAHIARSFNFRNAKRGLAEMSDLDNVVVDTSAICEAEAFATAIEVLGPQRILWGSDFPVSELRGRCVTTGDSMFWLHPEILKPEHQSPTGIDMTLVGIESILALKGACQNYGLTKADINDIFYNNASKLLNLEGHSGGLSDDSGSNLWTKAREIIPGGTGLLSKRAEMYDADSWPTYYSRCSGSEVWDLNGKRYVDFLGGVGSVLLGYSDPDVNAAVKRRITLGSYCSLVNPQEPELAEKLLDLHPWAKGGKVRFARTGGEAMSVAIRCARSYKNKSGIAFCGYHGWHDWYLAANLGEDDALDGHLLPGLEPTGVPRELKGTSVPFRYNNINSFDAAIEKLSGNLAAVVMEPMRSQFPTPEFIEHIVQVCRSKDIVLIVDEITSGMRHGYPGAHLNIGLQPDIVVYAKAMSNGIPFGAIVGKKEVMEKSEESFISSSYWTDGIGTAAALAVLEKAERLNLQKQVWEKGAHFQNELKVIARKYPSCKIEIAGMPPSPSITFHLEDLALKIKTLYIQKMVERGFLVSTYFYLMWTHTPDHLSAVIKAMDEVLFEINSLIESGEIDNAFPTNTKNKIGFARLA